MTDVRIQNTEEMVGAGHTTKSDTLNRMMLIEHNTDGTHKALTKVTDPYVDVRAFGSGRTDVEVQAAIDYIVALPVPRGVVLLEPATYIISNKVTVPKGIVLRGIYGHHNTTSAFTCNVNSDACVQIGSDAAITGDAGIENLTIQAGTGIDSIGLYLLWTYNCHLKKIKIINFTTGTGLKIAGQTTGGGAAIQNSVEVGYFGNNLINMHLTGEDADSNNSASDEGLFSDIRIQHSALVNSKGIYLEKGANNCFERITIFDSGLTAGTIAIHLDDGSRNQTYSPHGNNFYGTYIENLTTPIRIEANCSGNIFHTYSNFPSTLKSNPIVDLSGGANIIRYPVSGLNATHYNMHHHTQTYENLLVNSELERWEAGTAVAPTGWILAGLNATIARDASNQRKGTYCAALTRVGTDCSVSHNIPVFNHLKGRYAVAGVWVKSSDVNAIVEIRINDGVDGGSSAYHTGGGSYEYLSARYKVDSSATYVQCSLRVRDSDGTAYFDSAVLQEGYELTLPVERSAVLDSERLYFEHAGYNPPDLADGAQHEEAVTIVGAALGDFVVVAPGVDMQGISFSASVISSDTVEIVLKNDTGGNLNLGSSTWKIMIVKYPS